MFSFDGRVRYSECDETAHLSLVGMFNYFQDCSTFQSEHLGVGYDFMHEHHFSWFLSKWHVEIFELPRFYDQIVTSTWCYALRSLEARRIFQITHPDGRLCARADSAWFCYDTAAGKPCRAPDSEHVYLETDTSRPEDLSELPRHIRFSGKEVSAQPITVTEQLLDTNGHVNNAQYVMLAMAAIDEQSDRKFSPSVIDIQYRKMALLGDTIYPKIFDEGASFGVNLAGQDGSTFALVRLEDRS